MKAHSNLALLNPRANMPPEWTIRINVQAPQSSHTTEEHMHKNPCPMPSHEETHAKWVLCAPPQFSGMYRGDITKSTSSLKTEIDQFISQTRICLQAMGKCCHQIEVEHRMQTHCQAYCATPTGHVKCIITLVPRQGLLLHRRIHLNGLVTLHQLPKWLYPNI